MGDGNWNWKIGKFVEVNPCCLHTSTDFIWHVWRRTRTPE